jgi:hypothetical protein
LGFIDDKDVHDARLTNSFSQILSPIISVDGQWGICGGTAVLRDDEYLRLQAIFLAIAQHSDQPHERTGWVTLVQACQKELLTAGETRSKLDSQWPRAA